MHPLSIPAVHKADVAVARSTALRFARAHGAVERSAQEFAIIAGELASNTVRHAGGGVLELTSDDATGFVSVCSIDRGSSGPLPAGLRARGGDAPVIVEADGSVRDGLGCGLGAIRRLGDFWRVSRRVDGALEVRVACRVRSLP